MGRAIAYARVSTEEQAAHGYGLDAQASILQEAAAQREHELLALVRDEGASGKDLDRPGLLAALERIAAGDADTLIVAKLDRLTRSVVDFGDLLEWFEAAGASLVALDFDIDTGTPAGRMIARIIVVLAEWEREVIAARTKDGLAAARAQGKPISRPSVADDPELVDRIQGLAAGGLSLRQICARLNDEGVPTPRGAAKWGPSSLQTILGYQRPKRPRKRGILPDLPARRRRRAAG